MEDVDAFAVGAVRLATLLRAYGISTLDELAETIRWDGDHLAGYIVNTDISSLPCIGQPQQHRQRHQYSTNDSSTQTSTEVICTQDVVVMTDGAATQESSNKATQTATDMHMVDVATVELVLAEALCKGQMVDSSTLSSVSDASGGMPWSLVDREVQATPAPLMHRQTQAGSECVFRFDAETQADVSDDELGAFPRPQSCFEPYPDEE